ncbi:hypothetical protein OQA88_10208 [Cercophora sp. LCS_1]
MPIPFETLIPYGIIIAMFGVTGAGLSKIKNMQNGGKRTRRGIDQWDKVRQHLPDLPEDPIYHVDDAYSCGTVMDRDRRLTGFLRGQANNPVAPAGFELSNGWKVEKRMS